VIADCRTLTSSIAHLTSHIKLDFRSLFPVFRGEARRGVFVRSSHLGRPI